MSALAALKALAAGETPPRGALSGTCRLGWQGCEAYGEEAVLKSFRGAPLDLAVGSIISTPGVLMWTDGKTALVGDLYDERLGQLWRIGSGRPPTREPVLAVPFDTDLTQGGRDVLWRPDDHLWLAPEHADAIETLAGRIAAPSAKDHRVRAFVLRAFSADGCFAMLASVFRLSSEPVRTASFCMVAALVLTAGELLVADDLSRIEWVPRL